MEHGSDAYSKDTSHCYVALQVLWITLEKSPRYLMGSLNRKFLKFGTQGNLPHPRCRPAPAILL